jgi:hypothetical protein
MWYAKKSDWAAAQAAEIRKTASALRRTPAHTMPGGARRSKWRQVSSLEADAARWDARAQRYRDAGQ